MRIISLLPAATEWVYAFGAGDLLAGRSHACDHPAEARALPVLTRPRAGFEPTSGAIDGATRAHLKRGLSLFEVDLDTLLQLRPGLILTQAQCDVRAVSALKAQRGADWGGAPPRLFSLEPMTLKAVLDAALRLGREIERSQEAIAWIAAAEARLRRLRERLGLRRSLAPDAPTVVCIEWMEPIMTAGHWMPNVAELAGGRAVLARRGERSSYTTWDAVRAADPDVIAVMPCGFSLAETRRNLGELTEQRGWNDLRAVRAGRVFLFDGNAYFNRPGPRLYRSIELLAAALQPERCSFCDINVQPWEAESLDSALAMLHRE